MKLGFVVFLFNGFYSLHAIISVFPKGELSTLLHS